MIDLLQEALNDERCWTVYIHTNKTNQKRYVGITSRKVEYRWGTDGCGYKTQPFYSAIEKYGWDGFDHDIIAENLTEDEANNFEIFLIKELDSLLQHNGYNTTEGGKGTKGLNTDRSMYTGANASNVRRVICLNTMEIFDCIKDASEKYNTESNTICKAIMHKDGYKSSGRHPVTNEKLLWEYYDETKSLDYYREIKDGRSKTLSTYVGKKHHRSKSVICLTTGKIFGSGNEANRYYGIKNVGDCCKGKYKHSGKLEDGTRLEWMFYDDYIKINNEREAM